MTHIVGFLAGFVAALAVTGILYFGYIRVLAKRERRVKKWNERLVSGTLALDKRVADLNDRERRLNEAAAAREQQLNEAALARERRSNEAISAKERQFNTAVSEFNSRLVHYDSLQRENASLKQDLFNLSVQVKKTDRDQAALDQRQQEIDQRMNEVASRYLNDNVSWISAKLNPNNFSSCRTRLQKVADLCRSIGFNVSAEAEESLVQNLKTQYERVVREDFQRQEQARIRAQIREEEKFAREIEKQIQDAEREEAAIRAALERALEKAKDEHSAEVENLKVKLQEAEAKAQRAKSLAQMTRAGHVYVLSNIGAFGDGVFKIGMTRRLEPLDRVSELSNASVPFPFDVHMMISCDDAPTLENALHRELHKQRVNKVNLRKEFFKVNIESIRQIVELHHGEVDFVASPEALQYRETVEMPDEDFEFIENTVQSVGEEAGIPLDDE